MLFADMLLKSSSPSELDELKLPPVWLDELIEPPPLPELAWLDADACGLAPTTAAANTINAIQFKITRMFFDFS